MESRTPADQIPGLYRSILDGVAQLERVGMRTEATRCRASATAAYSGAWNEAGHRRLRGVLDRIQRAQARAGGASRGPRGGTTLTFAGAIPVDVAGETPGGLKRAR